MFLFFPIAGVLSERPFLCLACAGFFLFPLLHNVGISLQSRDRKVFETANDEDYLAVYAGALLFKNAPLPFLFIFRVMLTVTGSFIQKMDGVINSPLQF